MAIQKMAGKTSVERAAIIAKLIISALKEQL